MQHIGLAPHHDSHTKKRKDLIPKHSHRHKDKQIIQSLLLRMGKCILNNAPVTWNWFGVYHWMWKVCVGRVNLQNFHCGTCTVSQVTSWNPWLIWPTTWQTWNQSSNQAEQHLPRNGADSWRQLSLQITNLGSTSETHVVLLLLRIFI